MRNAVTLSAVFCLLTFAPVLQCQDEPSDPLFSPDQLDNLLAQVALYPDPLLAQLLVAATYPDQIEDAAHFVQSDSYADDIDHQPWDVSVKAVAHYPTVIAMMADQIDWTTALGQAYVNQPDDVMDSVQRLRADAQAAGNLQSDAQIQVVDDNDDVEIWPEQPQYMYVPVYDPAVIYTVYRGLSWGLAYPIGAWLNIDFDWHAHRVTYHGWQSNGSPTWVNRSLPFVRPSPVYVNGRLRNVTVNRNVLGRRILYADLDRYQNVHRGISYRDVGSAGAGRNQPVVTAPPRNNTTIERNSNPGDPGRNVRRAYIPEPQPKPERVQRQRPVVSQPDVNRAEAPRPRVDRPQERPAPPAAARGGEQSRPEVRRPEPPRAAPAPRVESAPRPAPAPAPPAPREERDKRR